MVEKCRGDRHSQRKFTVWFEQIMILGWWKFYFCVLHHSLQKRSMIPISHRWAGILGSGSSLSLLPLNLLLSFLCFELGSKCWLQCFRLSGVMVSLMTARSSPSIVAFSQKKMHRLNSLNGMVKRSWSLVRFSVNDKAKVSPIISRWTASQHPREWQWNL